MGIGYRNEIIVEHDGGFDDLLRISAIAPGGFEPVVNEPAERKICAKREDNNYDDREMRLDPGKDDTGRKEKRETTQQHTNGSAQDTSKMKVVEVQRVFERKPSRK